MATTIRKCVSLAPSEPGPNGSPGNEQDLRNCIDVVRDSGSRWIKLWARWDRVQQQQIPWYQLGDPSVNTLGYKYVAALDAQIDLARSQNPAIGVLLQSYCFPQWLNGTSHLTTRAQDIEFYPQDRMSKATYQAGDPGDSRRPLIFRVPPMEQLGVEGAWGGWVRFLYERYKHHGLRLCTRPLQRAQSAMVASADREFDERSLRSK